MTRINNTPTKFKTTTNNTKNIPRPGDVWLCFCRPPHKRPAKKQRYFNKLHTNKPSNQLSKASKTIIKQKQWNMSNCWLLYTSNTKDHALWWKIPEGAPEGRQAGAPGGNVFHPCAWAQISGLWGVHLAASNGLKRRQLSYLQCCRIYSAADICDAHVGCHELLGQSYLIPQVSPIRILSRFLVHSRSTRHLNTPFAMYMFALSLPSFSLVALILFWAELLLGSKWSSSSHL